MLRAKALFAACSLGFGATAAWVALFPPPEHSVRAVGADETIVLPTVIVYANTDSSQRIVTLPAVEITGDLHASDLSKQVPGS